MIRNNKAGAIFQEAVLNSWHTTRARFNKLISTNMKKNRYQMKTSTQNKQKRYRVVTLAVTLMGAILLLEGTAGVASAASPTGITNVVLVHGAFADGSGWEAVAKK